MRFGVRLTLFITVMLLVIQAATIFAVNTLLRDTLMDDGKGQVAAAELRFVRQLAELETQLAESVRLLTLDYALRHAIAYHDAATVVSALRNHGHRIGASRMLSIEPGGTISGDTSDMPGEEAAEFPDPALLERAAEDGRAGVVAIMDGKPIWLVAVPVMAPDPIAYVAAALPLDDAQLSRIHDISGVPGQIGIIGFLDGAWRLMAGTVDPAALSSLPDNGTIRTILGSGGGETIVITRALATARNAPSVRVLLDYPLSEALRRYQRVCFVVFPLLTAGLLATLAGVVAISRGIARPLETLARQTKRIANGDYRSPPPLHRTDELGQLSIALRGMTQAIAEREQDIRHRAAHDPVTGLANRPAITEVIAARTSSGTGAVLVAGLIRWREITSTVGREVGDRLLREAAARILARFDGRSPSPSIGSIGESTFAIWLAEGNSDNAMEAAAHVISAFDTPYQEGEFTIDCPVAVGISLLPEHGTDAAQLLRRAEIALQAAAMAENRSAEYRFETDPHRPERLSLMSDLRVGLMRGEFTLMFQPKLNLNRGRITDAEALIRWRHPTRGLVMPDEFIALAEETGNIQHVTRWALREGLTEVRRWRDQGLSVRVAINLSVRDLADATLPDRISSLLRELELPPRMLVLEITEGAIMDEPEAAIAMSRRLAHLGVDLAIDDFGVGQSSLAYLRRLPVREIKLDKAFVLRLPHSQDDQTIVKSVIELGHGLGFQVTAEGVEDADCLRLLRDYGCDYAQGYYVGRPMPSEAYHNITLSWLQRCRSETAEVIP